MKYTILRILYGLRGMWKTLCCNTELFVSEHKSYSEYNYCRDLSAAPCNEVQDSQLGIDKFCVLRKQTVILGNLSFFFFPGVYVIY